MPMSTRFFRNEPKSFSGRAPGREVLAFHRSLPGYEATTLVSAPDLAARLGVADVLVKDESNRLGLPSFKILGASWAVARALAEHAGKSEGPPGSLEELAARAAPLRPLTLAAATGNHGRAVARMARLLGLDARIFVPRGTARARIEGIESEGAEVEIVAGTYDDAVARSAAIAGSSCIVVSDTSWPGYDRVPCWVIEGYSTILIEIDEQLTRREAEPPNLVFVQMGVGALAAAVVRHFRRPGGLNAAIVGVEPTRAACILASIEAGGIVSIPGPHDSIMAGLNCGTPSLVAWPEVSAGIDLYLAIEDERAREAMRLLADVGIVAGETGAAGLGALLEVLESEALEETRAALGLDATARVLLFCAEGATDPDAYREFVDPDL
jgi:diaminopropionate ammonia-lyase